MSKLDIKCSLDGTIAHLRTPAVPHLRRFSDCARQRVVVGSGHLIVRDIMSKKNNPIVALVRVTKHVGSPLGLALLAFAFHAIGWNPDQIIALLNAMALLARP